MSSMAAGLSAQASDQASLLQQFFELAEKLSDAIRCSEHDLLGKSKNPVRDAFKDLEEELETLFCHAEDLFRLQGGVQRCDVRATRRRFRQVVTGYDVESSCAKIVATILAMPRHCLLDVWTRLLGILGVFDAQATAAFCDLDLPFSLSQAAAYFGDQNGRYFERLQHKLCPEMPIHFGTTRDALRNILSTHPNTIICAKKDLAVDPRDVWSPQSAPSKVFAAEHSLTKDLYRSWASKYDAEAWYQGDRRTKDDAISADAIRVFEGVKHRARILATLIYNTPSESPMWVAFFRACGVVNGEENQAITDASLPFKLEEIGKYLHHTNPRDESVEHFYSGQFRFCPPRLAALKDGEVRWRWPAHRIRLPLTSMEFKGEGAFGKVYKVKVAAGFLRTESDVELAMKVIKPAADSRYVESDRPAKLLKLNLPKDGIMLPLSCVRTKDEVFIFMKLADCNLHELLMGRDSHGTPIDGIVEPQTCEERKQLLVYMIDIAKALRSLHHGLTDSAGRTMTYIHRDIKTENMLCTLNRGSERHLFEIADFGTCAATYTPTESAADIVVQDTVTGYIPRNRSPLGKSCKNMPPEGDQSGEPGTSLDVWGYGVAFAEHVAFLAGGKESLESFEKARARTHDSQYQQVSFEPEPISGAHQLKESIQVWFTHLINSRTHSHEDRQLFRDCWELLEHDLLVCSPEQRATMNTVCEKLQMIIDGRPTTTGTHDHSTSHQQTDRPSRIEHKGAKRGKVPRKSSTETKTAKTGMLASFKEMAMSMAPLHRSAESVPHSGTSSSRSSSMIQPVHHPPVVDSWVLEALHKYIKNNNLRDFRGVLPKLSSGEINLPISGQTALDKTLSLKNSTAEDQDAMLAALIDHGADWSAHDTDEDPFLHRVARMAMLSTMGALLVADGVHVDRRNSQNRTALHCVLNDEDDSMVPLLVERNASIDIVNRDGFTVLHYAVRCIGTAATEILTRRYPELLNTTNEKGQTPLHICAHDGDERAFKHMQILLNVGQGDGDVHADLTLRDSARRTPMRVLTDEVRTPARFQMFEALQDRMIERSSRKRLRTHDKGECFQQYIRAG